MIEELLSGNIPINEETLQHVGMICEQSPETARQLVRALLEDLARKRKALDHSQQMQKKLTELHKKLTAAPWHPATFLGMVDTTTGPRAEVIHGSSSRLVAVLDDVEPDGLERGDELFLGNELNVVMAKAPLGRRRCGETAPFDHRTPDGRLVLQWRDSQIIVDGVGALRDEALEVGDMVRWNHSLLMAFERLERAEKRHMQLEKLPDLSLDQVGGQAANLQALMDALTTILVEPDLAETYGLSGRQSILLVGPPGCGKTLMVRVVASQIQQLTGQRCLFWYAKPGEWEDPYVGVTQQNIRRAFETLRRAADNGDRVVAYLDEIEAVGRMRGGLTGRHADKFLAALLAELDGMTQRGDVAIITASNRKDLIDPALLERISDVELVVDRPDMRGAEAIFGIHMPASLPYYANGYSAEETRRQAIEAAVQQLYSPNAENDLCTLRLRDGSARTVAARQLLSGRVIEQMCRAARRRAFLRHAGGGEAGIQVGDLERCVEKALSRMRTTLTPRNAHSYLPDLPQDIGIVAVERIEPRVDRPSRYRSFQLQ